MRIRQKYLVKCLYCKKESFKSSNGSFCNAKCQNDYDYEQYIQKWLNGEVSGGIKLGYGKVSNHVRRYMFSKNDNKCEECGWSKKNNYTETYPLQIDHKDGNPENHSPDNLVLICPNCHSLKPTHSTNKQKGRRYYQELYHKNKNGRMQKVTRKDIENILNVKLNYRNIIYFIDGNEKNIVSTNIFIFKNKNNFDLFLKTGMMENNYANFVRKKDNKEHPCKQCLSPTLNKVFCSRKCSQKFLQEKGKCPSKETLSNLLMNQSLTDIGRLLSVDIHTVKGWIKRHHLTEHKIKNEDVYASG